MIDTSPGSDADSLPQGTAAMSISSTTPPDTTSTIDQAPARSRAPSRIIARNGPTKAQQDNMVEVFAERIYPQVPDNVLLSAYLRHNSWDFEATVSKYTQDRETLLASLVEEEGNNAETASESSPVKASDSNVERQPSDDSDTTEKRQEIGQKKELEMPWWFNDNNEQERRDAGLALRLQFEDLNDRKEVDMTPSEAVLLLHMVDWDISGARKGYNSLPEAKQAVRKQFDRMRSRLPTATVRPSATDKLQQRQLKQQDERLATFVNITGRSDWFSLKVFLQKRRWNIIAAIEAWFRSGVPPVMSRRKHVVYDLRNDFNMKVLPAPFGQDWQPQADGNGEDGWALDWETVMEIPEPPPDNETSDDESDADPEVETENPPSPITKTKKPNGRAKGRPDGFALHQMKGTAKPGLKSDWRFLFEYISKGRYWSNRFKAYEKFDWPDVAIHDQRQRDSSQTRVQFDWNNQEHIHLLNNFRRQNTCRTTNTGAREAAQLWSDEEKEFLLQMNVEWLEEMRKQFPGVSEDDLLKKTISNKTKEDWKDRLNAKFQGTVQEGSTIPRRERSIVSIISQRARTPAIIEKFKLKADSEYFRKRANRIAKEKSKGDSGVKRPLEADQEDDGQPAEKRARIDGSVVKGDPDVDENDDCETDVEGEEVVAGEEETEEADKALQ